MTLFSGKRPQGLGINAGKFKPCSWKPNCVSSTADQTNDTAHFIAPLQITGNPGSAWSAAVARVKSAARVTIVTETATYLHAEYASKALGYVDDVELSLDPAAKVIHIRSASRLGVRDFGVNRARVEALRGKLDQAKQD